MFQFSIQCKYCGNFQAPCYHFGFDWSQNWTAINKEIDLHIDQIWAMARREENHDAPVQNIDDIACLSFRKRSNLN